MATQIAVVGSGVMGSEIAQVAAAAGNPVVLFDSDTAALERAEAHIRSIGERRVAKDRMTPEEAEALVGRIEFTDHEASLSACEVAIEAVPEVFDIKRAVFTMLDGALPPGAIMASNTSGLSITDIARVTVRPERVVGLHFFNPASVMRLVEVVRGADTDEEVVEAGRALAVRLGKTPVLVRECPGFLVNRILVRAMASAYLGARDDEMFCAAADTAVVETGPAPMGPFSLGDLIGLDTFEHIRADLAEAYDDRYADGGLTASLVSAGRLGRKSDRGYFSGTSPAAEADAAAEAVARAYYEAAADEARRCLEEGIAEKADIDLAMQLGCGWEYGPLEWAARADTVTQG